MSTSPSIDLCAKAVELAEAGRYQEALELMEHHLDESPDDPEALNDAAVLLHCLDRSDLAAEYLTRAHELSQDPRITWNLAEALVAEGKPSQARSLFESMEAAGILSTDILNRTAYLFLNEGKLREAAELMEWSCRIDPRQGQILGKLITTVRSEFEQSGKEI